MIYLVEIAVLLFSIAQLPPKAGVTKPRQLTTDDQLLRHAAGNGRF